MIVGSRDSFYSNIWYSFVSIKNINDAQPNEVQMTGKAGDAYLFYRDIDHSRAENLTSNDNVQIIYAFVNKNTRPAANNRECFDPTSLKDVPMEIKKMLHRWVSVF